MANATWTRESAGDARTPHAKHRNGGSDASSSARAHAHRGGAASAMNVGVASASKAIKKPQHSGHGHQRRRSSTPGGGSARKPNALSSSKTATRQAMEDIFDLSNVDATEGRRAPGAPKPKETDEHKLKQRQRQIDYGKNTLGYARYLELVDKSARKAGDIWTPDIHASMSKRAFDGCVRKWRRLLHAYDPPVEDDEEIVAIPVNPFARPEGTLKPGEFIPEELAEAARRRAEAKATADAAVREGRRVPDAKLAPLRASTMNVTTAPDLPSHAEMSPGWQAITPTPYKPRGEPSRFGDASARRIFPQTPATARKPDAEGDVDMMECDGENAAARSIYDDWEGEDFAGVV